MSGALLPGSFVRHPGRPDWGLGQVQSAIGKRAINGDAVALEMVEDSRRAE